MLAGEVSNKNVGLRIAKTILLMSVSLCAQPKRITDATIVSRAKQAIISKFDPALPSLTLESFLNYETGDQSIDWRQSGCKEDHSATNSSGNDGRCVTAYSSLADGRVVTVCIFVPTNPSIPVVLVSVAVIERGLQHRIRLIEIPAVVQGARRPLGNPRRQGPRDLFPLSRVA